jgi:hypothetical protein
MLIKTTTNPIQRGCVALRFELKKQGDDQSNNREYRRTVEPKTERIIEVVGKGLSYGGAQDLNNPKYPLR